MCIITRNLGIELEDSRDVAGREKVKLFFLLVWNTGQTVCHSPRLRTEEPEQVWEIAWGLLI